MRKDGRFVHSPRSPVQPLPERSSCARICDGSSNEQSNGDSVRVASPFHEGVCHSTSSQLSCPAAARTLCNQFSPDACTAIGIFEVQAIHVRVLGGTPGGELQAVGRVADQHSVRLDHQTPCPRPFLEQERTEADLRTLCGERCSLESRMFPAERYDCVKVSRCCRPDDRSHGCESRVKPSSFQPSIPPAIFFTRRPRRARLRAALSAPLQ